MLKKVVLYLQKGVEKTSHAGLIIGAVITTALIFLVVIDVSLRKAFAAPVRGSVEITEIALGTVVFLGLAYCASKDGHVVLDILVVKFRRGLQKWVMGCIHILSACVSILIAWRMLFQALNIMSAHQVSIMLGIPLYPFWIIGFLGFVLLTLVFLIRCVKTFSGAEK